MSFFDPSAGNADNDGASLDLNYREAEWAHGDLTVILTWTMHNHEPCLAILPTARWQAQNFAPPFFICVVPLATAYRWADFPGAHGAQLERETMAQALRWLPALGCPEDARAAAKLRMIIQDHLGELVALAPFNEADFRIRRAVAAVQIFNGGRQIDEAEVFHRV